MNILKERFEIDYFGNRAEISRYCYTRLSLFRFDMKNGMYGNLYKLKGGWRFEDKRPSEIAKEIGDMIEAYYESKGVNPLLNYEDFVRVGLEDDD